MNLNKLFIILPLISASLMASADVLSESNLVTIF